MFSEETNISQNNQKSFIKLIVIGTVITVAAVALVYYIAKPKHEQEIHPPSGLENAVRNHINNKFPGRAIVKMRFYNCEYTQLGNKILDKPAYSVLVSLEPKTMDPFNYKPDVDREWKVMARWQDSEWFLVEFNMLAGMIKETPCGRGN